MDLELNDAQRRVRDAARDFSNRVLAPNAARYERDCAIPREVLAEMAGLGLMGVNIPEALGGAGAGVVAYATAMREVARGCAATAVTMAVTNMVGEVIAHFGTPEQKKIYVERMFGGKWGGTICLTEPHAGSDVGSAKTSATKNADGSYNIKGTKIYISGGDHDLAENRGSFLPVVVNVFMGHGSVGLGRSSRPRRGAA
jgi:alkylation response protein AidB-like acyl-CoA dehydrogenase